MKAVFIFAVPVAVMLALSACGKREEAARQDVAGGEILQRSVSDDMLPFDSVRSRPPLAPRAAAGSEAGASSEAEAADDAAGEAQAGSEEAAPTSEEAPPPAAEE